MRRVVSRLRLRRRHCTRGAKALVSPLKIMIMPISPHGMIMVFMLPGAGSNNSREGFGKSHHNRQSTGVAVP